MEILRDSYANMTTAFNSKDVAGSLAKVRHDVVRYDHGAGEVLHGKAAVEAKIAEWMRVGEDASLQIVGFFAGRGSLTVQYQFTARHENSIMGESPTGAQIAIDVCMVAKLDEDDLIYQIDSYWSPLALFGIDRDPSTKLCAPERNLQEESH